MRAILAVAPGGPEVLEVAEVDVPTMGRNDLLVKVELASVNFADINARRGVYTPSASAFPRQLGLEVYGRVESVGDHVTGWASGDRVAGFTTTGGYADFAVVPQTTAYKVPTSVSAEQAAAFPVVGQTAYHLLTSASRPREEDWIVVTAAAGGVGRTSLQIAGLLGHQRVIAAAGSRVRVDYALRAGAVAGIDYSSKNDLSRSVHDLTGGHGADLVLDAVGGEVRASSLRSLAQFGLLVQFGNASGEVESLPIPRELRLRNIGVTGFNLTALRERTPEVLAESACRILGWMRDGALEIDVADVLPLASASEAHRLLEARTIRGKLLLSL